MSIYVITTFDPSGRKLLEETFEAQGDKEAKRLAVKTLTALGLSQHTYRVTRSGKLILFHS